MLYTPCSTIVCFRCFIFNNTPPSYIYTLSLHDALPIWRIPPPMPFPQHVRRVLRASPDRSLCMHPCISLTINGEADAGDRKSTRLNSSHLGISYAVFCLKKKKKRISYLTPR